MKLNLEYYKEELDNKIIPEEFEAVLEKINSNCVSFADTLDTESNINTILALSEIRENLLNWYDFKSNCKILELNANYGELTGLLCDKAERVVSIESSKRYAELIKKRYENRDNLEIISGELQNIKIKESFDYIVIVGIANEIEKYIDFAKVHLKDDGKIFIAVNNKFGVKSWISLKEGKNVVSNFNIAISESKIKEILELNNLNFRFYYPLPDYKMPNIIYTKTYIPNLSNIDRDLIYKDEDVNFGEVDAYRTILSEDATKFYDYANSFLIEVSKNKLEENFIKFITFSNIRKDEYRIKTIINNESVYKYNVNNKSLSHLNNLKENVDLLKEININSLDRYDDEKIISEYCNEKTLDRILVDIYLKDGIDGLIGRIKEYIEFLKQKLQIIEYSDNNIFSKYGIEITDELKNLTYVKYGFWDLIFQNCFVIDNDYYFYDQEWLDENIPVEFIIYRAILYFNEIKRYIPDEVIFEKLEYTNNVEIFKQLDNKLQEQIRKPLFWHIHTKRELKTKEEQEINRLKEELEDVKKQRDNLQRMYVEKNNDLAIIKDSFSWRITRPLRKIRGMGKKDERK